MDIDVLGATAGLMDGPKRIASGLNLAPVGRAVDEAFRPGWTLTWSDEFDVPGLPDSQKWGYETGFVRNHEKQIYMQGRSENARVEEGFLIIETHRETVANPRYDPAAADWRYITPDARYTSAALTTAGKSQWLYGRIEARAKLPQGGGIWPAIWTLGAAIAVPVAHPDFINWPRCGEIDVVEHVGSDPQHVHGTAHFQRDGKHASRGGKHHVPRPGDDFHIYAVEWSFDSLDFFFDGLKYHSVDVGNCTEDGYNGFRQPHHLIVNVALGGDWAGVVDDAMLPQKLMLDYVRVYQRVALS